MFNAGYKKEAIAVYEKVSKDYSAEYDDTLAKASELHKEKENAVSILKNVDEYIHSLSNKPKELEKKATEIAFRRKEFEKEIKNLMNESKKSEKINKNIAGAGTLAGVGVATLGPAAAMGIATTFGTASTGTAIAALAGAAQTNAALAWLGGGALAAGGGGVAAGEAFLALAGPVGWAIGGTALVGSGLMANSKNKKIAEKAKRKTKELKEETLKLKEINLRVVKEKGAVCSLNSGVKSTLDILKRNSEKNYKQFTKTDKDNLILLLNTSETLSKRIGEKID